VLAVHAIVTTAEWAPGTIVATQVALSVLDLAVLLTAVSLAWSARTTWRRIGHSLLAAIGVLTVPGVVGLLNDPVQPGSWWWWLTLLAAAVLVVVGVAAVLVLRDEPEVRAFRERPSPRGIVIGVAGIAATWASLVVRLAPADHFPPSSSWQDGIELAPTTAIGQVNLLVILTSMVVLAATATSRPHAVAVAFGTPLAVGFVGQVVADVLLLVSSEQQLALVGFPAQLEPGAGFVTLLGATGALVLALSLPRRKEEVNGPS
jgi:putative effector of murein hydrolase LrgA (UPF0299 family)